MKIFIFLGFAVTCVVAAHDPGLRVKFAVGLRPGTDFFFDVPRSIAQAVISRWRLTPRPKGPLPSLSLYCHADLTVCALFDDTGSVAGLQIALSKDEFTDNVYDMKTLGFTDWEVNKNGVIRKFWAIQMYFVSEEYLQIPASEREANRDNTKLLQEGALWLTGINGKIEKVPGKDSEIQKSIFTRQACTPWMGRHYYYNMTKTTECLVENLFPWFPLTDLGNLMAVGLMVAGNNPIKEGARDWFEHPSRFAVSNIVPNGPECLYDLADKPGVTTMHVYFINKPWGVGCPLWKK